MRCHTDSSKAVHSLLGNLLYWDCLYWTVVSTSPPFTVSCLSCLIAWWYPSSTSSSLVQVSVTTAICGHSLSMHAWNSSNLLLMPLAFVYQHFSFPWHISSLPTLPSFNDFALKNYVRISPFLSQLISKFPLHLPFFRAEITGEINPQSFSWLLHLMSASSCSLFLTQMSISLGFGGGAPPCSTFSGLFPS